MSGLSLTLLRLWFGTVASVAAGYIVWGSAVFNPGRLQFHCLTIGAIASGIFALALTSRLLEATALASALALFRFGSIQVIGLMPALSGVVLASGLLVVGLILQLAARTRLRFGKFLLTGPLVGSVYLAAAPLSAFHSMNAIGAAATLIEQALIGTLIGAASGLGVELAGLFHRAGSGTRLEIETRAAESVARSVTDRHDPAR